MQTERGPRADRPGLLMAALWLCAASGAAAEKEPTRPGQIQYGAGRQIARLANRQIHESSGLACSRRTSGVFWTHNDSGDGPVLYAFDTKGSHLASLRLQGAQARDWEDMASFRRGGKSYLLVGDIGDNRGRRASCTIYVVAEPAVNPRTPNATGRLKPLWVIRFRYEGGPVNCEAVGIDPTDGTILLVSKEAALSCKVYALPWPKKPTAAVRVAKAIAELAVPIVTAMDISPDGRRAVVLTYLHACEFVRGPGETWSEAFSRRPRLIPMPPRRQGESICYGPDGKTLYLTSEKLPTPLIEVPVIQGKSTDHKKSGGP